MGSGEEIPCSCNGTNENCWRCNGSGYIPVPERRSATPTGLGKILCPYCQVRFKASAIDSHQLQCWRRPSRQILASTATKSLPAKKRKPRQLLKSKSFDTRSKITAKANEPTPWVCPLCYWQISGTKTREAAVELLLAHAQLRHPHDLPQFSAIFLNNQHTRCETPPATEPSIRNLIACPECKVPVRQDRLQKHRKRVHHVRTSERHKLDYTKRCAPTISDSIVPFAEDPLRAIERGLDGSRDHWRIREHGRFGSHPVHDDYGEESEI